MSKSATGASSRRRVGVGVSFVTVVLLGLAASCRHPSAARSIEGMDIDELGRGVGRATLLWQVFRAQNSSEEEALNRSPRCFLAENRRPELITATTYFRWMGYPDSWPDTALLEGLAPPGVPVARDLAAVGPENVGWAVVCGSEPSWDVPSDYPVFISANLVIETADLLTKSADDYVYCSTSAPFGQRFSLCIRNGGKVSVFPGASVRMGELFPAFILTNRAAYVVWRPDGQGP